MNAQRIIAVFCFVLALGALSYSLLSEPTALEPGAPRTPAGPIPLLAASVPAIGDFAGEFNVNLENPFVPSDVRGPEKQALQKPRRIDNKAVILPPPAGPVVVEQTAKISYPMLKPRDAGAPECFGVLRKDDTAVLVAGLPGKEKTELKVGDALGGWTLKEVLVGIARFADPMGEVHDLPIGSIASPQTINQPPAAATSAPAPSEAAVPAAPATRVVPRASAPLRPGPLNQPSVPPGDAAAKPPGLSTTPMPAPDMVPRPKKPK